MFNNSKYTRTYFAIVKKFQNEPATGYAERHHILPKSLGGTNDPSNLVVLSAKAHYVAHLLLTKMTSGNARFKMICALVAMSNLRSKHHSDNRHRVSALHYEMAKRLRARELAARYLQEGNPFFGHSHTEETLSKLRGRPRTEAHRQRISESKKGSVGTFKGRKHSAETRRRMSEIAKGSETKQRACRENLKKAQAARVGMPAPNRGVPASEQTRARISESLRGERNHFYGRHHSDESRRKMSESHNAEPRKHCHYCQRDFDARNYGRWHGDNCKQRNK